MPRRRAKAPSSDGGLTGGSVAVISGSITTPDDPNALNVKLSIWDTEITMRVDGAELGNWEAAEVSIRAIDSTSFEFIAEGDRLIFAPDDPSAFAASSLVKGRIPGGGRKGRRKAKPKPDQAPIPGAYEGPSPAEESQRRKRRPEKTSRASKPTRRERKAAERESAEQAAAEGQSSAVVESLPQRETSVRQEAVPTPIGEPRAHPGGVGDGGVVSTKEPGRIRIPAFREPLPDPIAEPVETPQLVEPSSAEVLDGELLQASQQVEPRPVEPLALEPDVAAEHAPRRSLLRRTAREKVPDEVAPAAPLSEEPLPDEPEEPEEPEAGQPNRVWIRALDLARKYDFLGLDRVPVNESLRGQEHQHTWNHRVAPTSGPGKYICTICGEIRR